MKYLIIALLFASCLQVEKQESTQLDIEVQEIQRLAFWQRAFYFEATKWRGVNNDSAIQYERKMDSVIVLYKVQMLRYDSLVNIYKQQKQN